MWARPLPRSLTTAPRSWSLIPRSLLPPPTQHSVKVIDPPPKDHCPLRSRSLPYPTKVTVTNPLPSILRSLTPITRSRSFLPGSLPPRSRSLPRGSTNHQSASLMDFGEMWTGWSVHKRTLPWFLKRLWKGPFVLGWNLWGNWYVRHRLWIGPI